MEIRQYDIILDDVSQDGEKLTLSGYVNKTEQESELMRTAQGEFREKIKKGCFKRAIEKANYIDLLYNHEPTNLIASTSNNSLVLEEDEVGLRFSATLVDTQVGEDTYKLVRSGLISHMSFGFSSPVSTWTKRNDGTYLREIEDLNLIEVSVVRNPAYVQSSVSARNSENVENVELDSFLIQQNALKERISKLKGE